MKRKYGGNGYSPNKRSRWVDPGSRMLSVVRRGGAGGASRSGAVGNVGRAVAGALVRRAVSAIPGADLAYAAYRGYRAYRQNAVRRVSGGKYHTTGRYGGKFKRKRMRKSKLDPYLNNGFKNVTEVHGTVSDPDCVYVGHSTTSGARLLTLFNQACLRKLFKKAANLTITNVRDPLKGYQGFGDGWRLVLTVENRGDGTQTEAVYDTTTTDSIYRICGSTADSVAPSWPDLYNFWVNYAGQATSTVAGSTQMPVRLSLYQRDGNITSFYHFMGDIYFPHEKINLYVKSELKIQNRTLSAAGSSDAEDVSNNPLVGRIYTMNSGAPRTKVEGVRLLETIFDFSGVSTHRAAEFTQVPVADSLIMREPPEARIFSYVKKTAKVRLEPGAIKQDNLVYKVKIQCHKFWEMLDWRPSGSASTSLQMKSLGKCSIIALEDVINVNVAQNISIAYEVNREESMYLTTSKYHVAQGMYRTMVQNSNPA